MENHPCSSYFRHVYPISKFRHSIPLQDKSVLQIQQITKKTVTFFSSYFKLCQIINNIDSYPESNSAQIFLPKVICSIYSITNAVFRINIFRNISSKCASRSHKQGRQFVYYNKWRYGNSDRTQLDLELRESEGGILNFTNIGYSRSKAPLAFLCFKK